MKESKREAARVESDGLQPSRFPLSSIKNRTSHSMLRNLFNPLEKIVLSILMELFQ